LVVTHICCHAYVTKRLSVTNATVCHGRGCRIKSTKSRYERLFDFNQAFRLGFAVHFHRKLDAAVHWISRQDEMDLKEAIYTRRSTRDYTAAPVDEKTIREIIAAAVQAPSAVNAQPCTFCVVRDRGVLQTISREAKAHMVRTTPVGLMSHHFSEILNDPNFDVFYRAPVLILISTVADIPWAVEDCALAAENLMLSARAHGLGSCWIGFAQDFLGTPEGKALLKLPVAYRPVAPIIVGHPQSPPPPVARNEPEIRWVG
jgi:nitroreductase